MIYFSKTFPRRKFPLGLIKIYKEIYNYFDHIQIDFDSPMKLGFLSLGGYQSYINSLRNTHKNRRAFIIANGPGLNDIDISKLKNEITIGCNGIYKQFKDWGFHTTYYLTEDQEQTELRGKEISKLKGPIKFAALHNAHAFNFFNDINFYNVPLKIDMNNYSSPELYPQFSEDFSSIVHLGGTITYVMIQFAYHLGVNELYIIGLDHNYGKLPELFPPGKIEITEENYSLVKQCHFDINYYQIGDVIGVPDVKRQEESYKKAKQIFESNNRRIINASSKTKLDVFEKVDFNSIFS